MTVTEKRLITGLAGDIEIAIDQPSTKAIGMALIAHPHPLFGGTMNNKVVQTLAKTLMGMGYIAVRHNFRGVGLTAGMHDSGEAETLDSLRILEWMRQNWSEHLPLVLAGFSFGSFVQSRVAMALKEQNQPVQRMIMVGTAAGKWDIPAISTDSIVIHGECDDVIPLDWVLRWAEPQKLPVTVVAGAGHFFHGDLHVLKQIIHQQWSASTY